MKAEGQLRRGLGTTAGCSMALVLCGLLLLPLALRFKSNIESGGVATAPASASARTLSFKLSGGVEGLWPGARTRLRLRIKNPNTFAIRVSSLSVRPKTSDKPGCDARWLTAVKTKKFSLKVAPRRGAVTTYPIGLSKNAPDACQGASWPLRFTGTARGLR